MKTEDENYMRREGIHNKFYTTSSMPDSVTKHFVSRVPSSRSDVRKLMEHRLKKSASKVEL